MTLATTSSRQPNQTGNGAVNTFTYSFRIFDETDLVLVVRDLADVETDLVLATDYTVTGVGNLTGTIVLVDAGQAWLTGGFLTTGYILAMRRVRPITQLTDIRNQGEYFPEIHEDEFDDSRMIDQQLQEQLDRALLLSPTTPDTVSVVLPFPEADAPLGWASDGLSIVNNPTNAFQVRVDSGATQGFLGATGSGGVLRTGSNISYTDGGDFITLDVIADPVFGDIIVDSITINGFLINDVLDEDDMISDRDDALATQQSIKAYVDSQIVLFDTFLELTDTPAAYAGSGGFLVRVNPGATALVFGAESSIDHDGLTNFVANEHIDHTSVTITGGGILSGGGDISASRVITLASSDVDHDATTNFVADEHIAHSSVVLTAGTGLSGGGDITVSRTFDVTADYTVISANDGATDVTGAELETLTDGSNADALHSHAGVATDELVGIDALATPGFIGAGSGDGVLRTGTGLSYTDGGDFVTLAVNATYTTISANDGATNVTGAELETLTDGSNADALHTHAGLGTDELVAIDGVATPGFIGATSADGVLRTSTGLSYTDGGDFITLAVNATYTTISANDGATNVTGAELETLTDGSNADALHTHAGAGANTLDQAYDEGGAGAGRSITADTGAVEITGTNNSALSLVQTDANTLLNLDQNGNGRGILLNTDATSEAGVQIVANFIETVPALLITSSSVDNSTRFLVDINNTGTGSLISGLRVRSSGGQSAQVARFEKTIGNGTVVNIIGAQVTTQTGLQIVTGGLTSGQSVNISANSTALTSSNIVQIKQAANSTAWLGSMLFIESNNTDTTVRHMVHLRNVNTAATGTSVLTCVQNADKEVITLDNNGGAGFINYIGASGATVTDPISTLTTFGAIQGFAQIEIGGTKRWMPFYADPS